MAYYGYDDFSSADVVPSLSELYQNLPDFEPTIKFESVHMSDDFKFDVIRFVVGYSYCGQKLKVGYSICNSLLSDSNLDVMDAVGVEVSKFIANSHDLNQAMVLSYLNQFINSHMNTDSKPVLTIESAGNSFSDPDAPNILSKKLPGMDFVTVCPADGCKSPRAKLWSLVQHLNDTHKWTRDEIADWLDKLHDDGIVDLSFKTPEG